MLSSTGESTYFLSVNRNKRSIEVDFATAKGKETVLKLAESCDVVVENFIPGKLASMGLGYEHIKAVNPRIIYVSISGYGDTGPRAQQPGYDVAISAIGGLMSITGPEDGPPAKVGVALIDVLTGMYAVSAINAALYHREVGKALLRFLTVCCHLLLSSFRLLYDSSFRNQEWVNTFHVPCWSHRSCQIP